MARQLEKRLEELQLERARLREAIRRVGQSFAKGLDRDAVLEIVVQTAVDGVGADCGRAALRTGPQGRFEEVAGEGDVEPLPRRDPRRRGRRARRRGGRGDRARRLVRALAPAARPGGRPHPRHADRRAREPAASPTASASCSPTSPSQAGVSIENVDLHETVQRQAVTDELTGLFNHRRFQEVMFQEVERAKRFGDDDGPDHARHRQLQARQRHLRPHAGRPRPARGRAGAARVLARDRRARPLRRRGDGGRAARHRPRRCLQLRRARAPRDRGARAAADRGRRDAAG